MLSMNQLEEVLSELGSTNTDWFFYGFLESFKPEDLLLLPTNYIQKITNFIGTHDFEFVSNLLPKDFVKQATGEDFAKVVKMINVERKKQSLEQDFI